MEQSMPNLPTLAEVIVEYIRYVLRRARNKGHAARILGISRKKLWYTQKQNNLDNPPPNPEPVQEEFSFVKFFESLVQRPNDSRR
jgi:hypothetical protein